MTTHTTDRVNASFPIGFMPLEGTSEDCDNCSKGVKLDFGFEYPYQPIVDVRSRTIYAHEALVRGPQGESAASVLAGVFTLGASGWLALQFLAAAQGN